MVIFHCYVSSPEGTEKEPFSLANHVEIAVYLFNGLDYKIDRQKLPPLEKTHHTDWIYTSLKISWSPHDNHTLFRSDLRPGLSISIGFSMVSISDKTFVDMFTTFHIRVPQTVTGLVPARTILEVHWYLFLAIPGHSLIIRIHLQLQNWCGNWHICTPIIPPSVEFRSRF